MAMNPESTSPQPTGAGAVSGEGPAERCGQCGAAAAHEQRYCVNCGFHRRNAPDPVARYLSEASVARARVAAATTLAAGRRRTLRFGPRITALLVAVALLVGVVIGGAIGGGSAAPKPAKTQAARKHTTKGKSQVKNATGSGYVNQESSLPNSVTP